MNDKRAFLLGQQWYIRKDGIVSGPFAGTVIRRRIGVGRVAPNDELSVDQIFWEPVHHYPELIPYKKKRVIDETFQREREAAAVRWEDERSGIDRRETATYGVVPPSGLRDGRDRREGEDPAAVDHRDLRRQRELADTAQRMDKRRPRRQTRLLLLMVLFMVCISIALSWWLVPEPEQFRSPICDAAPSPKINWNDCKLDARDLRGARLDGAMFRAARLVETRLEKSHLSEADLSYVVAVGAQFRDADLRSAILIGADLRLADFNKANMEGADLSYANLADADLTGANLNNARLGKAIWVDGHVCPAGAVGRCDP